MTNLKGKLIALRKRSETVVNLVSGYTCFDPIDQACIEHDIENAIELLGSIGRALMESGFEDTVYGADTLRFEDTLPGLAA